MMVRVKNIIAIMLLALIGVNCTKSIPIPQNEYKNLNASKRNIYRVTTLDSQTYEFKKFSFSENMLIIHYPKDAYRGEENIRIPVQQIKSFEKLEFHKGKTAILLSGIFLVLAGFTYFLYLVSELGQLQ